MKVKRKQTEFQHFNMLILSELLSISDFDFIKQARDTFLAVDTSALGEVTY